MQPKRSRRTGGAKAAPRPPASPVRKLASPGDPLVTQNGEIIPPDSNKDIGFSDYRPVDVRPRDFRAIQRQDLDDLPAEPKVINACASVLAYTMLGVSDREITGALKINAEQLQRLREHEAYETIYAAFREELINVNSKSLHARIAGMAHSAVDQIGNLHLHGRKEETRLRASQDILDRAGVSQRDKADAERGKSVGLKIMILEEEKKTEVEVEV